MHGPSDDTLLQRLREAGLADLPASSLGVPRHAQVERIEAIFGPQTLGSLVSSMREAPVLVPGFGRTAPRTIRRALERALAGVAPRVEPAAAPPPHAMIAVRERAADDALVQRLREAGLADLPAARLGLPRRAKIERIEAVLGPQTLGSLVSSIRDAPALVPAVGARTPRTIRKALEQALAVGLPAVEPTTTRPPEVVIVTPEMSAAELLERGIAHLPERLRLAVRERYDEGLRLTAIGARAGRSRERARQVLVAAEGALRDLIGDPLAARLQPFARALAEAGGCLSADACAELPPGRLRLAMGICGLGSVYLWRGELFTRVPTRAAERRLRRLRVALRGAGRRTLGRDEAAALVSGATGWTPPLDAVQRLLSLALEHPAPQVGPIDLGSVLSQGSRATAILHELGRAADWREVEALMADGDPDAPAPAVQRAKWVLQLDKAPDVLRVATGRFVHRDHFGVPAALLATIAARCVALVRGRPGTVAAAWLHEKLQAEGLAPPELTVEALYSVLKRHPDIRALRYGIVAWRGRKATRRRVPDLVEEMLRAATRPLLIADIEAGIRRAGRVHEKGYLMTVLTLTPEALFLTGVGHMHRDRMGLTQQQRAQLLERARERLPADGRPVTASWLLDRLGELPFGNLVTPALADRALAALLRAERACTCESGDVFARPGAGVGSAHGAGP